jgi:hypothetical protein
LWHIALDLRVDADVVERAGHDRDDGVLLALAQLLLEPLK